MWKPKDIKDFESAVTVGVLEERHDFDAKRQLPTSGKELAKDIAAMTTDGGSLVYGVGEDANGQPRILEPFELAGARERIDQIAQHSISPSPRIDFLTLRLPDDNSRGYLIALLPASPQAPHQVSVGDDRRYYGRCETGNRRLSEVEVERLYERRQRHNVNRESLLSDCIAASPAGQPISGEQGFLQAFIQPALRDDDLWDRAIEQRQGEEQILLKDLRDAVASTPSPGWGGGHLGLALNWRQRGADKWTLDTAAMTDDPDALLFIGVLLPTSAWTGAVTSFNRHWYGGDWNPGVVSAHMHSDHLSSPVYQDEGAFRTMRCEARELYEDPLPISRCLLDRLLRAMSGGYSWDPLSE